MTHAHFEHENETSISTGQAVRRIVDLLRPHRAGVAFCAALLLVASGLAIGKGLLLRRAIDSNITGKDWPGLLLTVALYCGAQLVILWVNYTQRIRLERIGQRIITDLKIRAFDKILGLSVSFFNRHPTGRLMSRIESDSDSLRMLFTFVLTVVIGDLFLLVGMLTTMTIVSPRLTVVVLCGLPLLGALVYAYHRITTPRFLEARRRMANVTATITEFIHGLAIVQAFHRMGYAADRLMKVNREKFHTDLFVHMGSTVFFNFLFFIEAALIAALLLIGGGWAAVGLVTVGTLVMFIQFVRKMFEPLFRVSEELYVVQRAIAGVKRVEAILANPEIIPEPATALGLTRIERGVSVEGAWLSYRDDEVFALKDVTFELPVRKRIALVGVTGGGKSSIINLLLRFHDPQRGRVLIDGHNIRSMKKRELRSLFGLVLQDIYLFPGDSAYNISLDTEGVTREKVIEAARIVGADEVIERLPGGYSAQITERGANLSRGERQLLSFARALAHDPQVLILDEATSSIDPETERRIQRALSRLLADRTALVVAHRLSTILHCDEIIAVKDGRIVERGSHEELQRAGGYYHHLFELQFADTPPAQSRESEVAHG